jgi:hypothetical protein
MRQAIVTKYIGPTNSKGARVKATAEAGSITLSWDHALNAGDNHRTAAEALAKKFHWPYERLIGGGMPNNSGYCFVMFDRDGFATGPIESSVASPNNIPNHPGGLTFAKWCERAGLPDTSSAAAKAWSCGEDPLRYKRTK